MPELQPEDVVLDPALDGAILRTLPDEGSRVGYKKIFATSTYVTKTLNQGVPREGQISAAELGARLRLLARYGYVVGVGQSLTGRVEGYQRTELAQRWLAEQQPHTGASE